MNQIWTSHLLALQSRRSLQYRRKQTFPVFVNPAKENLSEDDNAVYFLSPDVNFINLDNISAPPIQE